jgi:hypothetical protein
MFWKKKSPGGAPAAPPPKPVDSNPYREEEARDFLAEAERILLKPDAMQQAAGVPVTRIPLRELLNVEVTEAANALAALLQGPNGGYRKTAALAFGQLGFDDQQILNLLETQKVNEKAQGNIDAIEAAIAALQLIPRRTKSSDLDRRRAVENLYEGRAWNLGIEHQ